MKPSKIPLAYEAKEYIKQRELNDRDFLEDWFINQLHNAELNQISGNYKLLGVKESIANSFFIGLRILGYKVTVDKMGYFVVTF